MVTGHKKCGLKSKWFQKAMTAVNTVRIGENCEIRLFTFPYYLATKCEAHLDRGLTDPWLSKDLEDIVYLLMYRVECVDEISNADYEVKKYIVDFFKKFTTDNLFNELIEAMIGRRETDVMVERVKNKCIRISMLD